MGRAAAPSRIEPALIRFAHRLRKEIGASHVLLFGSRSRDRALPDSDYDLVIVADLSLDELEQAQNRISLIAAVLPDAIDLLAS